jgi:hypothetical protein
MHLHGNTNGDVQENAGCNAAMQIGAETLNAAERRRRAQATVGVVTREGG